MPREKCKNRASFEQYFPRTLPQLPVTRDSGTSVTDFLGFFLFRPWNEFIKLIFLNIHKLLATRNSCGTEFHHSCTVWRSVLFKPVNSSFPQCLLLFLYWNSEWIQIWLLQTTCDFTDPTKAFSLSGFSSRLKVHTIYLFQVWKPVCTMDVVTFSWAFSKSPFETRGPELQRALRTPWIYSGIFPVCFISFPRNWWTCFSHTAEHFTKLCLKILFLSDISELRGTLHSWSFSLLTWITE